MHDPKREFIPAAGVDWLLPLYDPLLRVLGRDALLRETVLAGADLQPGQRVLDIGCGTGILSVLLKQAEPNAEVHGLDPDTKALARAGAAAKRAGVEVEFDRGFADQLPYADATFDRVFSSLMFHHLSPEQKRATLRGVHRVLRPGGFLHVLDFGQADGGLHGLIARLIHHGEEIDDNLADRIPTWMLEAGFTDVEESSRRRTAFGSMSHYRARRAAADDPESNRS
jgi:cyclopropane fatty-acyl-phospholipid synthase-like methyltransferase